MSSYTVIVQARTSSARLPGKVLMDVSGQPMLQRQLRRLRGGLASCGLVVATSADAADDGIRDLCDRNSVPCWSGSLDDVLGRVLDAARAFEADYVIRVGGDDPLIDPDCCNYLVEMNEKAPRDFIFASHRAGWPYGTAAELIRVDALEEIARSTTLPLYREHIIPFFFDNEELFDIDRALSPEPLRRPDYCLSVDFAEDLKVIREVFHRLREEGDYFPLKSVIDLLDRCPEIRAINAGLHSGFQR